MAVGLENNQIDVVTRLQRNCEEDEIDKSLCSSDPLRYDSQWFRDTIHVCAIIRDILCQLMLFLGEFYLCEIIYVISVYILKIITFCSFRFRTKLNNKSTK